MSGGGIDVSRVLKTDDTSSGLAIIGVEVSGQNSITVIPGANGCVMPDDIEAAESAFVVSCSEIWDSDFQRWPITVLDAHPFSLNLASDPIHTVGPIHSSRAKE